LRPHSSLEKSCPSSSLHLQTKPINISNNWVKGLRPRPKLATSAYGNLFMGFYSFNYQYKFKTLLTIKPFFGKKINNLTVEWVVINL
jgi:hypothetical protein